MRLNILSLTLAATLLTTAHAATIPGYPFVYVTGEAEAKVPPDVATATFDVLAEDPSATVAEQTVESRVNEVLKLLHSAGVSDSRIDASHAGTVMALSQSPFSSIGPTFGMEPGEGYVAAGAMEVTVTAASRGSSLLIPASIELSVGVHALVKLQ